MDVGIELPDELQTATREMVDAAITDAMHQAAKRNSFPPYMNQREASKYLHVAAGTFIKWENAYHIPSIRIDGVKRYRRSSLDEFMKAQEK